MLKFNDSFHDRTSQEQISYLKNLASSQNQALDLMQNERNKLAERVIVLEAQLVNVDEKVSIQKKTLVDAITTNNENEQKLAIRIQELETISKQQKSVIKQLRG